MLVVCCYGRLGYGITDRVAASAVRDSRGATSLLLSLRCCLYSNRNRVRLWPYFFVALEFSSCSAINRTQKSLLVAMIYLNDTCVYTKWHLPPAVCDTTFPRVAVRPVSNDILIKKVFSHRSPETSGAYCANNKFLRSEVDHCKSLSGSPAREICFKIRAIVKHIEPGAHDLRVKSR